MFRFLSCYQVGFLAFPFILIKRSLIVFTEFMKYMRKNMSEMKNDVVQLLKNNG